LPVFRALCATLTVDKSQLCSSFVRNLWIHKWRHMGWWDQPNSVNICCSVLSWRLLSVISVVRCHLYYRARLKREMLLRKRQNKKFSKKKVTSSSFVQCALSRRNKLFQIF